MQICFTKMEGTGNDFLVIDSRKQSVELSAEQIARLAHRKTGIGFDQMLIIESAQNHIHHIAYRIFNADGQEVQQCGNGARALGAYIAEQTGADTDIRMESPSGVILAKLGDDGSISVNMGTPDFDPSTLPFLVAAQASEYVLDIEGQSIEFGAVSMGNPHVVIPILNVQQTDVEGVGRAFQQHRAFPESVNVGFMQVVNRHHIQLRVFERGVGETLACGTGACAAVAIGFKLGLLAQKVTASTPGGKLLVSWAGPGQNAWLTGKCNRVYEGRVEI